MNNKNVRAYSLIVLGTLLMSVAIGVFYAPNNLVTGGITGCAIIIEELTSRAGAPVPVWLTNIVLNIPLFLIGSRVFGIQRLMRTLFATAMVSFWLFLLGFLPPVVIDDIFLVVVYGGVLGGVGLGLVFRAMATTGGTDMAASIIHTRLAQFSVSRIMFVIDATIICLGMFVFGAPHAMYAIVAVFITAKLIDHILEGLSFAKAVFIVSNDADAIAQNVMSNLSRGVTGLNAVGMYTKKSQNVLYTVVSSKEIVKLKEIVQAVDKTAFVIVADVREVMGEGF